MLLDLRSSGIVLKPPLSNIAIKCWYFEKLRILPFKGTDPQIRKPAQRAIFWTPNDYKYYDAWFQGYCSYHCCVASQENFV